MDGGTKTPSGREEATKRGKNEKVSVQEADESRSDDEKERKKTDEDTEAHGGKEEKIRIGTWNVTTLLQVSVDDGAEKSLCNLLCIMESNSIDILGVSETTWRGQGYMKYSIFGPNEGTEKLYHIFYSGTEMPEGSGASYGVAVILSPRVYLQATTRYRFNTPTGENFNTGTTPTQRKQSVWKKNMMTIDLYHLGIQVTQIYAPACSGETREKQRTDHATFTNDLEIFLDENPAGRMRRVVMRDFNEKKEDKPVRNFCRDQNLQRVEASVVGKNIPTTESYIDQIYASDPGQYQLSPELHHRVRGHHDLICVETQLHWQVPLQLQEHTHKLPLNEKIRENGFRLYQHEVDKEEACDHAYDVLRGDTVYINLLMEE